MKILLAIDGSKFSHKAVDELARMQFSSQTEVRIISVFHNSLWPTVLEEAITGGVMGKFYEKAINLARKSAEDIIRDAAQVINTKNSSLSVTTIAVDGSPKNAILNEAETYGADLIVVGSQGQGAFSSILLGSVSQYVTTHAKCSVLIVKEKEEK
jgi:nucleotide-binding universal stress UspA family protein